jgi:hypothetical protein
MVVYVVSLSKAPSAELGRQLELDRWIRVKPTVYELSTSLAEQAVRRELGRHLPPTAYHLLKMSGNDRVGSVPE